MSTSDDLDLSDRWEDDTPDPDRRRRRRRRALIALGIVAALVIAVGAVVGLYLKGLNDAYQKRTTVSLSRGKSDGDRPEAGKGRNFLLLGSDRRDPKEAKASGVYGQRSDVMMLVHVTADNKDVYISSFPRDLYVDIPGNGKDRINAALAFGGVPLTVTTVENYVGVPIENVGLIDFNGTKGLVDALGGVDVAVDRDFTANGKTFTKGKQHMDGETALVFVRQRKQFAEGDFQRNRNQQAVLQAIVEKLISRDTLTDPMKLQSTISALSPFLTTDDGLTSSKMLDIGYSLRSIRGADLHYLSVPHGEPMMTKGGASVVAPDDAGMEPFRKALREDDMGTYYSEHAGTY